MTGEVRAGEVTAIDAEGRVVIGEAGAKPVRLDGLRRIETGVAAALGAEGAAPEVFLAGGSRILASGGVELASESCRITNAILPSLEFKIDDVSAIRFVPGLEDRRFAVGRRTPADDTDFIFLKGKRELTRFDGVVESIADGQIAFERGGATEAATLDKVYGVVFAAARPDGSPERGGSLCFVDLSDGSVLRGIVTRLAGGKLTLRMAGIGRDVEVPWARVINVEVESDRLAYLSDLQPASVLYRPIVAPRRDWRKDASVSGNPIRLGGKSYRKGLGLASGTLLKFAPNRGYDVFSGTVGIDDGTGGRGDCVVVLRADGEERFRAHLKGGDEPVTVGPVDIAGVRELALEVLPGRDLDLADHVDLADACFLRLEK